MKKIILSIIVLGAFGYYTFSQSQNTPTVAYVAPQTVSTKKQTTLVDQTSVPVATPVSVPVSTPKPVPVTKPKPIPVPVTKKGLYNDGTYTGDVADAYYGNVQVQAVITNGKLSNVIFLDYPQDRSHSLQLSQRAMPILTQEAIQAQSANVNGVSGASDTSAAFQQSLTSALAQARA
ncbi:MAG: FMN-binding protein [bacterium]